MDSNSEERKIRFRTNEGLTGRVYTEQRPLGAQWETIEAKWKQIDLVGRSQIPDIAFSLTEAQRAVLHKELRWIVSFPLRVSDGSETLGVVNIDGLGDTLSSDEMFELYEALRGKVKGFASALDKLSKCRVTIAVANLDN